MDSITQFTLGAVVSTALLGRKLGPRKAALLGGILGTVPDLDVFLPFDTPVDAFVLHRGWTHSIFVHALAAPIFGELLVRTVKSLRTERLLVWITVYLIFVTHAFIDGMTIYGTRLFWPFYPDPVGVGSIFIIDPIYSLPLVAVMIWALLRKTWSGRLHRAVIGALVFSTAYMGLGVVLQAEAERRAKAAFAEAGLTPDRIFAIAAPFTTMVWKVIGLEEDRYHNLYLSLFDAPGAARVYTHPRHPDLIACLEDSDALAKLQWFSRGFYAADLDGDKVIVSDLRMGLTPDYVFRFALAERNGTQTRPIPPERVESRRDTVANDLAWLGERLRGRPALRLAEAGGEPVAPQVTPATC